MTKTYLILLGSSYNRDDIIKFLEANHHTSYWFYSLPYSFFVRSKLTALQLSQLIDSNFGIDRHFVSEVDNNYYGRLPTDQWEGFNQP